MNTKAEEVVKGTVMNREFQAVCYGRQFIETNQPAQLVATACNEWPGIAIVDLRQLAGSEKSVERWALVHRPSGKIMGQRRTKRLAIELAAAMATIGNWNVPERDLPLALMQAGSRMVRRLFIPN